MSQLFEPYKFCGLDLKNRLLRSATMENMAIPEKVPSKEMLALYERLARSDVGLIITSGVRPDRKWDLSPHSKNMCIDSDNLIPRFAELSERVHSFGCKVAMQLGSFYRFNGELVAPSSVSLKGSSDPVPRTLTPDEIKTIVQAYGEAGGRAKRAGYDAVQLNAAHGFPLSRFLSPYFNRRTDAYGGTPENRCRIIIEITSAIRERAGPDFPVFIKMNVSDFIDGGMTLSDSVEVAKIISQNGIAAIETSGGMFGAKVTQAGPTDPSEWREGYFMEYAGTIKTAVQVPVILVGGLRNPSMMEGIIREGKADLVAMSRPFIKEPEIVKRWIDGDTSPSKCVSCDGCMDVYLSGKGVHCVTE